jgi:hypothetical protein
MYSGTTGATCRSGVHSERHAAAVARREGPWRQYTGMRCISAASRTCLVYNTMARCTRHVGGSGALTLPAGTGLLCGGQVGRRANRWQNRHKSRGLDSSRRQTRQGICSETVKR